jgi:hypothetical protein
MRDLGVYAFGARTKRVYPLRKKREVLGSMPSCDSRYSSTEEDAREREGVWDSTSSDNTNSSTEEERRDRGMRGTVSTSRARERQTIFHLTKLQTALSEQR